MKRILAHSLTGLLAIGISVSVLAQNPAQGDAQNAPALNAVHPTDSTQPAVAQQPAPGSQYKLHDGDEVALAFAEDLSSKTASEGDPVTLTLTSDLSVNGVVVARAGSKAVGEITKAERSGMVGKAGELSIRLDYLKVGDVKVHLRGNRGKEGESGTTGAVVLTVLFGPIGLIKHGKNVEIRSGTPIKAYVSDDILVAAAPPAM